MRLKNFSEYYNIYQIDFHKVLPKKITLIDDKDKIKFKLGNVMKHSDMIQCTYDCKIWAVPETLEFDIYFLKFNDKLKIDVDITFGNFMASEFSILPPNKVKVIEYTSYGSKTDPTNTGFGFTQDSLSELVRFFNMFEGFKLGNDDFKFLASFI